MLPAIAVGSVLTSTSDARQRRSYRRRSVASPFNTTAGFDLASSLFIFNCLFPRLRKSISSVHRITSALGQYHAKLHTTSSADFRSTPLAPHLTHPRRPISVRVQPKHTPTSLPTSIITPLQPWLPHPARPSQLHLSHPSFPFLRLKPPPVPPPHLQAILKTNHPTPKRPNSPTPNGAPPPPSDGQTQTNQREIIAV